MSKVTYDLTRPELIREKEKTRNEILDEVFKGPEVKYGLKVFNQRELS